MHGKLFLAVIVDFLLFMLLSVYYYTILLCLLYDIMCCKL